jgi:guanosine-3',5'-bis(diphosphate) 3'-pyrophosphohydrolase
VRRQYAGLGRRILDRAFERARRSLDEPMLLAVLPRLAQNNLEDMLAAVGRGEIPSLNVVKAVYPDHNEEKTTPKVEKHEEGWFGLRRAGLKFSVPGLTRKPTPTRSGRKKRKRSIPIRGVTGDMPVRFAEGGALPGERIVGIAVPGEGVTIYPIGAQALKAFDDQPERWLDVRWDVEEVKSERFPARIEVTAINEPGTLAQIAQVIADTEANISNIRIAQSAPDFSVIVIDVDVFDVKHLNRLIAQMRTRPVVSSVTRLSE